MIHDYCSITHRWVAAKKRRRLLALIAGACVLALPASAVAGSGATRYVQKFTVSPDTMCGFTGTSYWVWNLLDYPEGLPTGNGSSVIAGQVIQTFVADNGRGVKITYGGGGESIGSPVNYPNGSSSITVVAAGLNVKVQALGGALLEQSTGRLTYTFLFDANGDFVSLTIDSATGAENNVTGMPDCSVVGPYLAGI
jgi:hypothetical protein